jgi:hypothetical protein
MGVNIYQHLDNSEYYHCLHRDQRVNHCGWFNGKRKMMIIIIIIIVFFVSFTLRVCVVFSEADCVCVCVSVCVWKRAIGSFSDSIKGLWAVSYEAVSSSRLISSRLTVQALGWRATWAVTIYAHDDPALETPTKLFRISRPKRNPFLGND